MLNENLVRNYLEQYNEDELFYKSYYNAKHASDPRELADFLSQFSLEEIKRRQLICPDLDETFGNVIYEDDFFQQNSSKNVWVIKHNRYSPIFIHTHTYFEIFYVLSGSCTHYIHDHQTTLNKGSLCFISPQATHSIGVFDDSIVLNILIRKSTFEDIFFNILRSHNILSEFFICNLYNLSNIDFLLFTADDDELEHLLLTMLLEEFEEDDYTYRLLNDYIGIYFTKLVRKYGKKARIILPNDAINPVALEILSFLNDNYHSISLEDTARHFGYSPEHTSRLIKATTGKNFTTLLRNVRIRRAEALLLNTPFSIETISYDVGYETPGTFIKYFKQAHNMTPAQYRKLYTK